jgi:hypothetical protein
MDPNIKTLAAMNNPKEAMNIEAMRLNKIELMKLKQNESRTSRLSSFSNFVNVFLSEA